MVGNQSIETAISVRDNDTNPFHKERQVYMKLGAPTINPKTADTDLRQTKVKNVQSRRVSVQY